MRDTRVRFGVIGAGGIAPPIKAPQLAATEDAGFAGAGEDVGGATAKRAANAETVLDDDRERLGLVHQVEEPAAIAACGVASADRPAVPDRRRKGFRLMLL